MININQLTFGYHQKQTVLENLTLNLKPGHVYGLLGGNGAGKSSLLHCICGLLFPAGGTCSITNENPANRSPRFLQQVFLLPEEVHMPSIPIKQYLNVFAPFYPAFDEAMFYELLSEFSIPADGRLHRLSYGQKKKVYISFALATKAKILLMDEPTNGLDIPSKKQLRKIIAGAVTDDQLVIISTHQVKDLDSLIDHVLILEDKQIILNESVERITQKLSFKQTMSLEDIASPIYCEGALKGYAVVAVNHTNENSRLDMEMFFNAILAEKQLILSQF